MSIASLKQLASVFSNCPEDNKNECVDREKHIQVSDFDPLKEILKEGEYIIEGHDYNIKDSYNGEASITYTSSTINTAINYTFASGDGEVIPRSVTLNMDSSNRVYYQSTTSSKNTWPINS